MPLSGRRVAIGWLLWDTDMRALQDRQPATVTVASPSQAEQHKPSDSHEQVNQPKSSADDLGQAADRQVPPTGKVTHQQMQDSGYADAFAQIMEAIPDHVKQHASTQPADPKSVPQSDSAPSQPASVLAEGAYSSEVGAAVAAAMDQLAKQQEQQQQAVSLDVGAAYPEHAAQVGHYCAKGQWAIVSQNGYHSTYAALYLSKCFS